MMDLRMMLQFWQEMGKFLFLTQQEILHGNLLILVTELMLLNQVTLIQMD